MHKLFSYFASLLITAGCVSALHADTAEPPTGIAIQFQSVQAGKNSGIGYWDQPGYNTVRYQRGAPVLMYENEKKSDQQFTIVSAGNGWYNILTANGKGSLTIEGAKNADGARLVIWDYDPSAANQKYRFVYLGSGRWKIFTSWERAVTIANRSVANASQVHTWSDHNGDWMEWYIINAATGRICEPGPVKGILSAADTDAAGKKTKSAPGISTIDIMSFNPTKTPSPYTKQSSITTSADGSFTLPEILMKEPIVFLLSHSPGRSSAYTEIYPKEGNTVIENFESELISKDNYILDDDMYRGKQYYYLENGLFYRHKGIRTHKPDFFFPGLLNIDKTKPANAALLKALGGGENAKNEEERIAKFGRVFAFLGAKTKSYMTSNDPAIISVSNQLFANCRRSQNAPLDRWPSFDEYAAIYAQHGFIPVGNCTAWSQLTATLMYGAGIQRDTFFISKFRYDPNWLLEHWVIGFKACGRWYSVDPQACTVKKFSDTASFKKCAWDNQGASYDFRHPFEIVVLPAIDHPGVLYMGDPAQLKAKLDALNIPVFFQKNKSLSYIGDGMECTSRGTASVTKIEGNVVTLKISTVNTCPGENGEIKKKSVFEMKITCRNGIYYYGDDSSFKGTVESGGKILDINGNDGGFCLSVK